MSHPALPCCLGHHVLEQLHDHQVTDLNHPESNGKVVYRFDPVEHVWERTETDRFGVEVSSQELYSLAELFDALKIDDVEGFCAVIDGEPVAL